VLTAQQLSSVTKLGLSANSSKIGIFGDLDPSLGDQMVAMRMAGTHTFVRELKRLSALDSDSFDAVIISAKNAIVDDFKEVARVLREGQPVVVAEPPPLFEARSNGIASATFQPELNITIGVLRRDLFQR
jgi:hypothetical protein